MGTVSEIAEDPVIDLRARSFAGAQARNSEFTFGNALAELENIDESITTSLLTPGFLPLPEDTTVDETTPVETVSVAQVSATGEVAADCSSGNCECEEDFVKNSEGVCEAVIPDPQPVTFDCYDGNNGGCSHHCNQVILRKVK